MRARGQPRFSGAGRLLSSSRLLLGASVWVGGAMPDPKPRKRVLGVHIGDKGAGGSIRPLMKPRNHAVSYRWRELGFRLCIRFGHLGCRGGVPSAAEGL